MYPLLSGIVTAGGLGLRQALTVQAQRALIRSGSKRAEALEALTVQVADLQQTLQVSAHPCFIPSAVLACAPLLHLAVSSNFAVV